MQLVRAVVFTILIAVGFCSLGAASRAQIPKNHWAAFTSHGKIPVIYPYGAHSHSSQTLHSGRQMQQFMQRAAAKQTGPYGVTDSYLYQALNQYVLSIKDKQVAVISPICDWYESILLTYGAHPTTIKDTTTRQPDSRLRTLTVEECECAAQQFDAILSICSFQRAGLGGSREQIDPNADLAWMEKVKKMVKEDGILFLSVPVGRDCLVWNSHRIYGHLRLKQLLKGWRILGYFGFEAVSLSHDNSVVLKQPIIVLRPTTNLSFGFNSL